MKELLIDYAEKIGAVKKRNDIFQVLDQTIQRHIVETYIVCLSIDQESFEFLPIRPVDKALMPGVEGYIDQGVLADAFTSGKPIYIYDKSKYQLNNDEALILFPLIFSESNFGVIMIVTKQDLCKQLLNEAQAEFAAMGAITTKVVEAFDHFEKTNDLYETLKEVQTRADDIIESVVHGVMVVDENHQIKYFNKNAEIIFGLSAKEVKGKNYREVYPPRVVRTLDLLMQNTLIEGHILDFEIDIELNPEIKIPVGISTSLIRDAIGEHKGVVFICRDMSLTKEVNRLKDLDKMKSEFVSTVSHELKNPIAVVKSSVETLLAAKRLGKNLGEDFEQESMRTINGEIDRLSELINDLLSLSRIESGQVELNRQATDVRELLEKIMRLFEVSKTTHPITLECEVRDKILIDSEKIKQVIINFINNAIKYSPNGSDILVKAVQTGSKLQVSVTDRGLGIPEEQVGKVFDKFFRVKNEDTISIGGTGLGLAISRKIVELHYGKIWVTSKLQEGSTFGFDIGVTSYNQQGGNGQPEAKPA